MKSFIVSVPVFDSNMYVSAYRLFDRAGDKLFGTAEDYRELSNVLLSPGLDLIAEVGIEPLAGNRPLLVEINEYQLLTGAPANMGVDPEKLVYVLKGIVSADEVVIARCRELHSLGYRIAMEELDRWAGNVDFVELADYLILDYKSRSFLEDLKIIAPFFAKKQILIKNIPDMETFERLSRNSPALFSGTFYSQPVTKGVKEISPLKVNALSLINQVNVEDFDLTVIADTIERDPSLSISLLRFINSAAIGMSRKIDSIKNAVAILGQREVKRWVTVAISVTLAEDRPSELTKVSLLRAKFAEGLAAVFKKPRLSARLFMAGLFSMIDVILEKPMEEALSEIALEEKVREALLEKKGEIYDVLELAYAYERADWDTVSISMLRNNLDLSEISSTYVESIMWYKRLLDSIDQYE